MLDPISFCKKVHAHEPKTAGQATTKGYQMRKTSLPYPPCNKHGVDNGPWKNKPFPLQTGGCRVVPRNFCCRQVEWFGRDPMPPLSMQWKQHEASIVTAVIHWFTCQWMVKQSSMFVIIHIVNNDWPWCNDSVCVFTSSGLKPTKKSKRKLMNWSHHITISELPAKIKEVDEPVHRANWNKGASHPTHKINPANTTDRCLVWKEGMDSSESLLGAHSLSTITMKQDNQEVRKTNLKQIDCQTHDALASNLDSADRLSSHPIGPLYQAALRLHGIGRGLACGLLCSHPWPWLLLGEHIVASRKGALYYYKIDY